MKLSDYITFIHTLNQTGKHGWQAFFAGEERYLPGSGDIYPTKQMAAQALIENAMKLRHKEFTPTDQIRQE
jgi:hypothetical protein